MDESTEKYSTSCNGCIFASYAGEQQTGCDMGRLDKFKELGQVKPNDNFFIIDRVCNTCRGEAWANKHLGQNLVAAVEREVEVKMDFIILNIDEDEVVGPCLALANQCIQSRIKPRRIIFVIRNKSVDYNELYKALNELITDVPFELVRVLDKEADIMRCIDMGVAKCKSQYFTTASTNHYIPTNLVSTFNTIVNYDLKQIVMVEPLNGFNGMILQTGLFKMLGKNHNMPIFEKVREVAELQKREHQVMTWEQLWSRE